MKVYRTKFYVVLLICFLASVLISSCKLATKDTALKPVNGGLLQPLSKLDERHLLGQDSIKYAVAYHNAFFRNSPALSITKLEISEDNELSLDINQQGKIYNFKENLSEHTTEDLLSGIFATFIQPYNGPSVADDNKSHEIDSLLSSGDEFSYIKALRKLEILLKDRAQSGPSPGMLAKAAHAYLNMYLVSNRGVVSSFYIQLLSRAYALNTLALAQQQSASSADVVDDVVFNRAMLSYFTGNIRKAYDIALSPEGQKDPRCRVFSTIKDPSFEAKADGPPEVLYLQLAIMPIDSAKKFTKTVEELYLRNPENLFNISWLGRQDVPEGRFYTPMLVDLTIARHLQLLKEEYPQWVEKVPGGKSLFSEKGVVSQYIDLYKEVFLQFAEQNRFLSKVFKRKTEVVPSCDKLEQVNEKLFKGLRYPADSGAELFSVDDERLMFYHDILTALGQWHLMLTDMWGVQDLAMEASLKLNKVFEKDPFIRYLYGRTRMANDRSEAYNIYWDVLQKTGDTGLILKILADEEFNRNNASLVKGLVKQIHKEFPENGKLTNSLGRISLNIDNDLRLDLLREGILTDPWNIEAVYGLSWDSNDFTPMKRLLAELPGNEDAYYYAGFLAYNRMGDVDLGIDLLRKALSITPGSVLIASDLGGFLETSGKYDDALEVYRNFLKVDSESLGAVELEGRIGYILLKKGMPRDAAEIFGRLAETYKESAIMGAVFSYLALGDKDNAELWAKRCIERYPEPNAYTTICKLYYRLGETEKLMSVLKEFTQLYPQNALAWVNGWQTRISRKDLFTRDFGVMVHRVLAGGQAANVGIAEGDIIISYGGRPLDSGDDLTHYRYPVGKKEKLEVIRKGSLMTFEVERGILGIEYEY